MMEQAQVAAAFGRHFFTDQDELIASVRGHVTGGGTVVQHVDYEHMLHGWKDGDSDARWLFQGNFIRARKAWKFGDLIATKRGRARIADAFNHGHGWFDTTCCPRCQVYVVEDVMLS